MFVTIPVTGWAQAALDGGPCDLSIYMRFNSAHGMSRTAHDPDSDCGNRGKHSRQQENCRQTKKRHSDPTGEAA